MGLSDEWPGGGRRAVDDEAKAGQVGLLEARMVEEAANLGRDQDRDGHPVLGDRGEERLRREGAQHHVGLAVGQHGAHPRSAGNVVQRRGRQVHVVGSKPLHQCHGHPVERQPPLGEACPFGSSGGAAGVDDQRGVVFGGAIQIGERHRRQHLCIGIALAVDDRSRGADRPHPQGILAGGQGEGRLGVRQDEVQLRVGELGVQRDGCRAQVGRGQIDVKEHQPVVGHEGHPVAPAHPGIFKPGCQPANPVSQLRKRDRWPSVDRNRSPLGIERRITLQQVDNPHQVANRNITLRRVGGGCARLCARSRGRGEARVR